MERLAWGHLNTRACVRPTNAFEWGKIFHDIQVIDGIWLVLAKTKLFETSKGAGMAITFLTSAIKPTN